MTSIDAKPHLFHNWFNLFDAIVDSNTKIIGTRGKTYQQTAVKGKLKSALQVTLASQLSINHKHKIMFYHIVGISFTVFNAKRKST